MILLGLAGAAGSGKDTCADYLVRRYGFLKFSFSDALYREVAAAFGLEDESLLRYRKTKDAPAQMLQLRMCKDRAFSELAVKLLDAQHKEVGVEPFLYPEGQALSPRQILQWWGTEYRRAQAPNYWLDRAGQWMAEVWGSCKYPEHRPQLFVNTSVRFPNERDWVRGFTNGQVWHLRREGLGAVNAHVSEAPLEVLEPERELFNNGSIDTLHKGIELLLSTEARFVRCEPLLETPPAAGDGFVLDTHETQTFGPLT